MNKGEAQRMFFSRSIAFDDEDHIDAVSAARVPLPFETVEERFIEKLRAGDPEAFDHLVVTFSGEIFGLLMRLTESREEAHDLTQETFLSALTAIKGFRGESGLKTWLYRIAINHSRNRHRWWKRRRRDVTVSLDANLSENLTVIETISDEGLNPEDSAINSERQKALLDALGQLPAHFREAVVLCDLEGLSYEEIADSLGLNIGTVKSRIARGREELRRKLKDF
ncbi:MAG: sigma-70 family RNA polymerase sigma factor [Chloracidobacterium sp.]|nr:sigma-70 family RNA polymerase sigma factor [Chloracidobacterium sp.]